MKNEVITFNNEEFGSVRCMSIDNEPWFAGKDVASALGYSNSSKAVMMHVDPEDKQSIMVEDPTHSQNGNLLRKTKTMMINESGLDALILRSRRTSAKQFKNWITNEVLPSLNKSSNNNDSEPYEQNKVALVKVENNQIVTDSRSVAEHFGKEHKHVLEAIDNLVAQNSATKNMFLGQTREYRGRDFRYYLMNRDGFSLLVMGFTGKAALNWKLKYIEAFNMMEKEITNKSALAIPKDYPSALRALADEYEKNQRLSVENKAMLPKADFYDTLMDTKNAVSMGEAAKKLDMNIGRNNLFAILRKHGVLDAHNIPYQSMIDRRYFRVITKTYSTYYDTRSSSVTMVLPAGLEYIRNILIKEGYSSAPSTKSNYISV